MKALNHFVCIFQIQFLRSSGRLVFFSIIQILISLGIVIGFTYLLPDQNKDSILYLATGAPTLIMVTTGLVLLPQQIGNAKSEGFIDFMRTWPVKRASILITDTFIWLALMIPAIAIGALCAHWIFQPGYDISWTVIPAILLIALTCIGIGYGFSYALSPSNSLMLSQLIVFGALMFSPINFPIERLPEWLQLLHSILPLHSMAEVMRASLAASSFTTSAGHYINLLIWSIIGYGGAILILNRK